MAAPTAFWNRRGDLAVYPAGSQVNARKESVDREVVIDTLSRIGGLHRKLRAPQLWSEVAIIKALIYKHGNQHRKEKYFQGLRKVVKCVNRLEEIGLYDKVADLKSKFPRLSKRGFLVPETLSNYPSTGSVINILGYLTGAAQLLLQVMSSCQETFQYSCAQMVFGYFLTFHLTCSSSLSRVWVLAQSFLQDIAGCYDVIYPWLSHLADPRQTESSETKDLPVSLKSWLESMEVGSSNKNRNKNSKSQTPSTKAFTPGILDKMFASTPRQKPEEFSPPPFTGESSVEPLYDFGESYISDEVNRSLKDSEALTKDENLILKRRLFAENTEIAGNLHKLAEDSFVRSYTTQTMKRPVESTSTEGFSTTTTKKTKTDAKACFKRGPGRFSYCKKIHIFSDKRWKQCLQKVRRRKQGNKLTKSRQRKAKTTEDSRKKTPAKKSFVTHSVGAKSLKCSNSCNSPKDFSLIHRKNNEAVDGKRNSTLDGDFVKQEMSSLCEKSKTNTLYSDSCQKKLESFKFKTQRVEEVLENTENEDEIDNIFNVLNE